MNLRLRFALLFTVVVAVLLVVSSGTIFFLFSNYRQSEFFQRLKTEGLEFNKTITTISNQVDFDSKLLVHLLHNSTIYDQRFVVIDRTGSIIRKIPDSLHFSLNKDLLETILKEKEHFWFSGKNYQSVGLLLNDAGQVLIATGYDKHGFEKISQLRLILLTVLFGGLVVAAFVSFLFVEEAFKPLTKLSTQMKKTDFQNLGQRIEVNDTKSEINDIARNFNGMLERLDKAFDFQKSFVYHASHELRTPLATMLSETESALGKEMSLSEYKKLLISLKEEQQELIELTNSLLLISQYSEAGQQQWPVLRLDEILYETVSHTKRVLPDLSISIAFNPMPSNAEDLIIRGNETLLKSAFSNLLKNAYLYSVDQKVNITIEPEGPTILVHVDNKGTQLPGNEKENIMVPFFRGSNALKTKGFGLGLAIVHRFISIHNGTVTYTPINNNINRFSITLEKAIYPASQ